MIPFIIFLFALFFAPILSFDVFLSNSSVHVNAYYSTIGNPPDTPANYSIHIINKSDLQGDCTPFKRQASILQGKILIYNGTIWDPSLFYKCVYNDYALGVLVCKWAQDVGAVAVISLAKPGESDRHNKLAGFNSDITVPFIIVSTDVRDFLVQNADAILSIELPAKTAQDVDDVTHLRHSYNGLVIVNIVVYGILLILLSFLIYEECKEFYLIRKVNYHRLSIVSLTFFCSAIFFVWAIIDPFSYKLVHNFPSLPLYFLGLGSTIIVFMLILKIWVKATGESEIHKGVRILLKIIYVGAIFFAIISILVAALWYNSIIESIYGIVGIISAVITCVGMIYYGRNIVKIIRGSGNNDSLSGYIMSSKIILCAILNTIATIVTVTLFETLGGTFGALIGVLFGWFGVFASFLLLFFKLRRRQARIRRMSEAGQIPPFKDQKLSAESSQASINSSTLSLTHPLSSSTSVTLSASSSSSTPILPPSSPTLEDSSSPSPSAV